MLKRGRKKEISQKLSKELTNLASNKAGGPYNLSKLFKISHPHISRCQTGEEGLSKKLAMKFQKYVSVN